jgi:hypothetical protein
LKLKIEGPLQPGYDGSIFCLKRELQFNEKGIDVPRAQGTFPNWVNGSKVHDRHGRTAPHHGRLQMFNPEATAEDQCLNAEDAKFFRIAFGICIYVSQDRYDIQHSVRALGTRIAEPTKTAM